MIDYIRCGTLGGTLFSVILQISTKDLVQTVLLAAVGAIASFCVSFILNYLIDRFHEN
ncbi:4-hydroxybenzoate polyprenyltransferase [Moheibacter stercoris]|uniref:4-hydroxybenzoate polyprenyltransferase n=1 Tax=Moheibacter stercoris TaxID=1628251 RepID=A0ABV2LR54_9FLAO